MGMFRSAPLPDGIDIARGVIDHVFPGLFAVCMQFVLTDIAATEIDRELRRDRRTFTKRIPGMVQFITPFHQKQESVSKVRDDLRERCARWFVDVIPGYFSMFESPSKFPFAELLFVQEAVPFENTHNWMSFMHLLGIDRQFIYWEDAALPSVRVSEARAADNVLVMAARERDFRAGQTDEQWASSGGAERYGYTAHVSYLHRSVTIWALSVLLHSLERRLSGSRNSVASVDLRHAGAATKQLQERQQVLLTLSRDLLPICAGLKEFSADIHWFRTETYDFRRVSVLNDRLRSQPPTPPSWKQRVAQRIRRRPPNSRQGTKEPPLLFEELRVSIGRRVDTLLRLESDVRQAATSQASAVASLTQNRSSTIMVWLTAVIAILTAVLIFLTIALVRGDSSRNGAPVSGEPTPVGASGTIEKLNSLGLQRSDSV